MRKKLSLLITLTAVFLSLVQLHQAAFGIWETYLARSFQINIALILIFLIYPLSKKEPEKKLAFCMDISLAFIALILGLYMAYNHLELVMHEGDPTKLDLFLGGIWILLVLEATRRTVGFSMLVVTVVLVVYTIYGRSIPGILMHPGSSVKEIIDVNYLSFEGILGVPVGVLVDYIFIFVIFACFLIESGISDFFKDFSNAIMGDRKGGAGKVAVVSSAFIGSISGSAAANVMTTGSYTIPTMKKMGYPPTFAGAIEAAASTGGQFMPPIMAAAGFLIAAYIGIPYVAVAVAAAIPALLYFASVGISIHLSSSKHNLIGIPKDQLPRTIDVLKKRGILLLPILLIIFLLYKGYSPMYTGFYSIIGTILVSFFFKETRLDHKRIFMALENAGKTVLQLTATCACAGMIVSAILLSGLGMKMPFLIRYLSGDSLFIALIIIAIGTLILSTGMTTTAGYVIGATLMAPVLITQFGVAALAAHLFVLYFAIITNVTPPVALASYAAASLAGANLWKTAIRGFNLAISGFVVPFLFIKNKALLLDGSFYDITISIIISLITVISLSIVTQGFYMKRINYLYRMIYLVIPIGILSSHYLSGFIWIRYLSLILFCSLLCWGFFSIKIRNANKIV